MKAQHTPGHWSLEYDYSLVMKNHIVIGGPIGPDGAPQEEKRANARLIAAAPELLSELMHISERIGTVRPNDAFCQALKDLADKVIQKATGHEAN